MIGKTVGHIHNDNARGIVLATGESARGKTFVIVDWFVDKEKSKVEAKRHSPEELVELNEK
tara:strand:+ start:171 stop:353 length:183 start_codon:yes stop_codon:yes gene_type:complete